LVLHGFRHFYLLLLLLFLNKVTDSFYSRHIYSKTNNHPSFFRKVL
jgi:hypothetical protein